jgi:L-alanine-DL-glutamate epimerase-like enolase superfamily enzyme
LRISSVETFPVAIPLAKPVQMSNVTITKSNNVLVKVSTDEGIVGWGEGVEALNLTGESQSRIKSSIDALGASLVGKDPLARTHHWLSLGRQIFENTTAIGALDIALHDIAGKANGLPVHELLGGAIRHQVPALTLIGSGDPDADLAAFETKYESGYRWFKVKLGIGEGMAEVKTLTAIAAAANDVVICGDVNAGWREHESMRFLRAIEGLPIRYIEQPTADRDVLARVAASSPVPICADESAHSLQDIAEFGPTAIAGVSLKLIKLGGITGVMRGAVICDTAGLEINLAGKIAESSIAAAANLHCAAAMSDLRFGCSTGNQGNSADVTEDPIRMTDGQFNVPAGPGLGVEVDEELVRALA